VFNGLGKTIENIPVSKGKISAILRDYHWLINSIKVMRESMAAAGERIVRTYDIDSDMPKAQGGTSDPVFQEIVRREKRWKNIYEYEVKVKVIQERIHLITDERELEVLHLLLDGKSYSWIARHMGLSDRHIRRIKDSIAEQMSEMSEMPTIF
jgi:DNA-binding NarL/FixJ family response regulator